MVTCSLGDITAPSLFPHLGHENRWAQHAYRAVVRTTEWLVCSEGVGGTGRTEGTSGRGVPILPLAAPLTLKPCPSPGQALLCLLLWHSCYVKINSFQVPHLCGTHPGTGWWHMRPPAHRALSPSSLTCFQGPASPHCRAGNDKGPSGSSGRLGSQQPGFQRLLGAVSWSPPAAGRIISPLSYTRDDAQHGKPCVLCPVELPRLSSPPLDNGTNAVSCAAASSLEPGGGLNGAQALAFSKVRKSP